MIFQLVILKKPNFQLMMKNQIFSCPEKAGKLQIEIPANSCLTGAEPGASQSVATMALDLMGEIPKTFSRPARTLAFSWVKARLHPLLTPCKSLTWWPRRASAETWHQTGERPWRPSSPAYGSSPPSASSHWKLNFQFLGNCTCWFHTWNRFLKKLAKDWQTGLSRQEKPPTSKWMLKWAGFAET